MYIKNVFNGYMQIYLQHHISLFVVFNMSSVVRVYITTKFVMVIFCNRTLVMASTRTSPRNHSKSKGVVTDKLSSFKETHNQFSHKASWNCNSIRVFSAVDCK